MGRMRNSWFPSRIAEYVTQPEMRTLRMSNTAMERDVEFGVTDLAAQAQAISKANATANDYSSDLQSGFSVRKAAEVEKVTPERSMQLLDIFVPKNIDFYRQPIPEETKEAEPEPEREGAFGKGAASELFAARKRREEKPKAQESQGIYGSVSTHDILTAVRAAMENNDESARVLIAESDIKFVNAGSEMEEMRVKHVGSYPVEIMVKNAEAGLRRTVRVHAQEV